MKPNFALTLSFEGIRLLHRSPAGSPLGWTVVGEVPLDEPNLAGAFAAMWATAVGLEPGGIRTKVMLPAEQVKVLDASGPGEAAARAALEGATPYAVADLAVDHVTADGRFLVAAIARDVLDEAEAFAAGHRFHPVSFAAVLPDGTFPGEAFFGESRLARAGSERVERDALPTVPRAQRTTRGEGQPAVVLDAGIDDLPQAGPEASAPESPEPADASGPVAASPVTSTADAEAPPSPARVPEPVFASRSRATPERESDAELPAPADPARVPPRAPEPEGSAARRDTTGDLRIAARAEPPVRRAASAPQPEALQAPPPVRRPVPTEVAPATSMAHAVAAPSLEPVRAAPVAPAPRRRAVGTAGPNRVPERAPGPAHARSKPRFLALILTAVLLVVMLAVGVLASSGGRSIAGLFGLADAPAVAAAPPPEAAPVAPSPSLAVAPAPAPATEVAAAPAPPDPEQAARAAAVVAAAIEALPEPEPTSATAPGTPVSPAEADRTYAATGVWVGAPRRPDLLQGEAVVPAVLTFEDARRPGGTPPAPLIEVVADAGLVAPPVPPAPRSTPTRAPAPIPVTPEEAPRPEVMVLAEGPPRPPPMRLSTPAPAEAAAPTPPTPSAPSAGTFVNAMAEAPGQRPAPRPASPDLPESMRAAAESAAPPPRAPLSQPGAVLGGVAADAVAQLSAPPAALAFAGAPEAEGEQAPVAGSAAGGVGLGAFEGARPPLRPDGLAPEPPEALARFEGPRPGLRPEGLAPEQPPEAPVVAEGAAEPATDPAAIASAVAAAQATPAPPPAEATDPQVDVQSALASIVAGAPDPLAGATRRAVAVARVPDARPRNFDRVVRDQLARTARAAQPAAAPQAGTPEDVEASGTEVAAAAAVPSGATAQSVAQAATFADVMAMREVNLIGVFGQPSDRRALVRMGNGRYMRVGVGDSLDGGQVTAIGDNALNYTKRGRQVQLVIPGG